MGTIERTHGSTYGGYRQQYGGTSIGTGSGTIAPTIKATDILGDIEELRFVPRICTTTYTPIMRAEQKNGKYGGRER